MALRDTYSWTTSRASAVALGRWWPALLVLALAWVAWLNAPSECALEESVWRDADAQLTRLMIRAHRGARVPALQPQSADANEDLLRAKRELESSLGELRMCRHGGPARAQGGHAAGTF